MALATALSSSGASQTAATAATTVARRAPRVFTSPSIGVTPTRGDPSKGRSRKAPPDGGSIRRMARVEERRTTGLDAWRSRYESAPLREGELFTSISGAEVEPLADAGDGRRSTTSATSGTRARSRSPAGVYPSMYRGRLWTMRQFAGFGTAQETNERFRYLLDHGQTGLSCAFDMPALMGVDSDSPRAEGEVGREGVAMASLEDMRVLFSEIPLGEVSTSMTINSSAAIALAMYLVVGEEQGVPRAQLRGTIQTDILKEYIAQKEFIFPPGPSMRLVTDMVEFCAAEMPLWHPISISGYHIREAGSTAAQELAFTLKNGFTYVEWALERGLASTRSRRGSRSSSTRISTSSRRSRSTAPHAGSGRASCATRTARATSARC